MPTASRPVSPGGVCATPQGAGIIGLMLLLARRRVPIIIALLVLGAPPLAACGDDRTAGRDATRDDADVAAPEVDGLEVGDDVASEVDGLADTIPEVADAALGDEVYGPREPPPGEVPEALRGAAWASHYQADLAPYWTMTAALGTPVGNYPTFRAMNGLPTGSTRRRPRMISRQIFAYVVGYLMSGDEALLGHAEAGVAWLRAHAIDRERGGCHPELEADGTPVEGVRTAQDQAYCMLGLAAWVFATRDPDAEADLLAGRDLLFDPNRFWDAGAGRVRDALDATLSTEVDLEGDGGWELVAQLDPINAFLLLAQPVLAHPEDRDRFLADMRALAETLIEHFHQGDFFWGVSTRRGEYRSKHADFGHAMKSVWMLLEVDKRLPDHPFHEVAIATGDALVARAFDGDFGRWAKRPTSDAEVEYGSDWWIYAEADQLTATLNLVDARYDDLLTQTQAHWLEDYVDKRYAGEVVPSIKRDGTWAWGWPPGDTAKCNEWKSGYHSSEHALVLSILGHQREGGEVELHFAVPVDAAAAFIARPYVFHGREVARTPGDTIEVGGRTLREVAVRFRDIY